jgi:hypothetical protein
MGVMVAANFVIHAVTMSLANAMNTHIHSRISGDAFSVTAARNKEVHFCNY